MSDEPDHNESGAPGIPGPSLDERENALRESEKKFSALYSSMVEGVAIHEVIYDGSGKAIDYVITDVNPAFESITGLGRHESVGKKASEAYGTGDAPYLDVYARVASSGKPESFETYFPPMQKHFSITVFSPAKNTFATVFHDITERKLAEEQIRRQAAIIDNSDVGVAVYRLEDPNDATSLRLLSLNRAGERIMRSAAEDVVGRLVLEAFPAADVGALERNARVALGGASEHVEEVRYAGDARLPEAYFSVDDVPLGNNTMAVLFQDITERKLAEAEIESLARFPAENPNPTLRLGSHGVVLYANAASQTLLREWGSAVGETAPAALRALAEEALGKQAAVTADVEQGERVWSFSVAPIIESGYANLYGRAITERRRAEEALRESEADLARAQAVGHIGSWRLDVQRNALDWSAESYRMFAIPPGTPLTYEAFLNCVYPEDRAAVDRAWQAALSGEPYSIDHRIIIGGAVRWIHEQAELELDEGGELRGGFGTCQDITERKRTEEALRQSEERFKLIATNTPDHILVQDKDLRYTWVLNPQLGLTLDDMIGKTDFDILAKEDATNVTTIKRRVLETGSPEYVSTNLVSGHGGMEYFEGSYVPTHGADGEVNGLIGYFRNVTERKRAEEELRLQANALQAAANGIVITDREGTIQWANEAFTRLTGYSAVEAIGQNPRVLKSGRHDAAFYGKLWKTILSGRVWQGEVVNKRKDDSFYTEEMTITPVLDAAGAITHFIAIKQDITERKRLEAELEQTRSEFLGEVGHELKTPLTAIKGCASIALSAPIPPDAAEARELFDIIDAQANRLTDLVANLLDVTRIEAGRLSMEPGPAVLAKIVEEARVIFEHSQYPHSLEVMLPPRLPALRADGRRIVQVLSNLFTNAAKYSAPMAPIILTAESGKGEVTVHVRDAGVGIPSDKMPLLFQKFVQVQERGAKGTGLGLFICKGIVEAHGGRIWAESAGRGKGTVFSFTLPAIAGKAATKREEKTAGGRRQAARSADKPIRVVAVDDELDILRYIEHCLRSARCEVVSTSDPLAAAALVRFHEPDILLLDMRMPSMSGLEVLEEIRKFSQAPVTFITATQNREDVERGREFGATTWLEKPFSPQQLLDHVGLVLARERKR